MKIRPELEVSDDQDNCERMTGSCRFLNGFGCDVYRVQLEKDHNGNCLRCSQCKIDSQPCPHTWKRIQHGIESTKYEWCEKCGILRWKSRYHQNMGYRYKVPGSIDRN